MLMIVFDIETNSEYCCCDKDQNMKKLSSV